MAVLGLHMIESGETATERYAVSLFCGSSDDLAG